VLSDPLPRLPSRQSQDANLEIGGQGPGRAESGRRAAGSVGLGVRPRSPRALAAAALALALARAVPAEPATATPMLENGYFCLTAGRGGEVSLRFDPSGRGHYADGRAALAALGGNGSGTVLPASEAVRVIGARYVCPGAGTGGYPGPFDHGEDLPPDGSLGQSFTVAPTAGWVTDVWALLTCSGVGNSAVTMALRRDGPAGPIVAQRRVQPLPNDALVHLPLPDPAPPGAFYLAISEKHGGAYWWSCTRDVYPDGTAFANGETAPSGDRCFGYSLADVGVMDWEARPVGRELRLACAVREQAVPGFVPALALRFRWQRDGYDTSDPRTTPFRYLYTDGGHWLPVEAFKRLESDWALEPACTWAYLHGTGGFDLRLWHGRSNLQPRLTAHRMQLLLGAEARVEVLPADDALPEHFPRFFTSDPELDGLLNEFLLTFLSSHTSCPSSYEWDALKLAWVGGPVHESFRRCVLHFTHRIDPDGYIWSRGESRGWDGSDCSTTDSRHYDSNAPFILACWRLYAWTGDPAFLEACMGTVRRATDYLLGAMHGREGLLTIDSPWHTGVAEPLGNAWPSSYWDCIPAGYQDAYINAFFPPALQAAAELERGAGNGARAAELERIAALARDRFNQTFWDDARGRYIGWVDAQGGRHDWGMTYVNAIAATYGLAGPEQVRRMYRWMEEQPTEAGVPDTFSRWIFAPRSNTQHCAEQANRLQYEEWCEDGGAILWTAFYEILSRAQVLGADNAWQRFRQILGRFAMPDHLVGGNPLCRGETNNHGGPPGSVGVWGEFPESGIVPCAFLYAFVGVRADVAGLHVRPNLPADLSYAGVDGLVFHGHRLRLTAYRDHVKVQSPGCRLDLPVGPGGGVLVTEAMLKGAPIGAGQVGQPVPPTA